jgi:hypothetical protein
MEKLQQFDTLVLEIQKDGKSLASISINSYDLHFLKENHGFSVGKIVEDMFDTMTQELSEKNEKEIEEKDSINS